MGETGKDISGGRLITFKKDYLCRYIWLMENATKVWTGSLADYWFDEDGIFYARSKPGLRTVQALRENFDLVREITNGRRVCVIIDNTTTSPFNMDSLMYMLKEFLANYKAVAFVSRSPIGKVVGSVANELNTDGVPIKIFKTTEAAKKWIMKYK